MHTGGPLLIIAGAGAGKTKTITHRIAHLIENGVPSHHILAVTFTNKAAAEMRERVRALVPKGKGLPLVTTFHSLGVRLLREFHESAGLPRAFSIWDRDDSVRALKRIQQSLDDESQTPRALLSAISRHKSAGRTLGALTEEAENPRERTLAHVWREYEKAMHEEDALDFDDLLLRTRDLLRNHENIRSHLQERFTHLTIDEYQDTNGVQYDIAELLTGTTRNICVVGDIDQNIYSWRGANLEHLLEFEKSFPGTKVVLLEQNYRSTRTILSAANAVIEKNVRRKPKVLFTENETGEALQLFPAQNEVEEAYFIAMKAREMLDAGIRASEIAILYRENFQSRAIEEAFLRFGVPYRVLGTRFFERKEVKDLLSYLRGSLNAKSRIDVARAAASPARGIGTVTLNKMFEGAALSGVAAKKVESFLLVLKKIREAITTLPASEAMRFAIEASGIGSMYKEDNEEGHERLENIRELLNLATKYDFDTPPEGIEKLLEEAALQSDQDELSKEVDAVSMMTVHAAKGLEFDVVFITGLEQGLFPSTRGDSNRDSEEERRLFYVALTRARKRVFLSYASARMRYGEREYTVPSEFLDDIDDRLIEYARKEHDHEDIII
jgi:DNA helicase-2/ATP-dependent DNA helicase PcrA